MERQKLTESEKLTMKCVWDTGEVVCLSQIMKLANEKYGKAWKSQTVSTFLGKLTVKGYLEQHREGRYCRYKVLVTQDEYREEDLAKEIKFWYDGDMKLFARDLMSKNTFTEKERNDLKQALK